LEFQLDFSLRKIFSVHQKFFTFPITNMWQVYTRPTSASDFFLLFSHEMTLEKSKMAVTDSFSRSQVLFNKNC
jgi:hypothetical protein